MQINRCGRCLNETTGYPCPHCGFEPGMVQKDPQALKMSAILNGRYLVGGVLGRGRFGLTYTAFDLALEQKVAIKEYLPDSRITRNGTALNWPGTQEAMELRRSTVDSVMAEARKMSALEHISGIVGVRDMFQGNGTAYIVMDFVEGRTLTACVTADGPMSWQQAQEVFLPAIRAMAQIHQAGLVHRSLSPDNIMLTDSGKVKILDLGAAIDLRRSMTSVPVTKTGFSPVEQYTPQGTAGPVSDVYAMAATMYYTLTGVRPQDSGSRISGDTVNWELPELVKLPQHVKAALQHAMAVQTGGRTRDMNAFLEELQTQAGPSVIPGAAEKLSKSEKTARPEKTNQRKNRLLPVLLLLLLLLAGGAAGVWFGWHPMTAADCSEPATCRICGKTDGEALGHDWQPADCTSPAVCLRCSATGSEASGHDWAEATCTKPRTCLRCGLTEGTASGHQWTEATCTAAKTCASCGAEDGSAPGHIWNAADCTTARTCSVCHETDGQALGHQWVEAVCEAPRTCQTCGLTQGSAIGHSWTEASCTTPRICKNCGRTDGTAPGHSWTTATCTQRKSCKVCGITEGSYGEHSWQPATYSQPSKCSVCGTTTGNVKGWVGDLLYLSFSYTYQNCNTVRDIPLTNLTGLRQVTVELDADMRNGCRVYRWKVLYQEDTSQNVWKELGIVEMPEGTGKASKTFRPGTPINVGAFIVIPDAAGGFTYGLEVSYTDVQIS